MFGYHIINESINFGSTEIKKQMLMDNRLLRDRIATSVGAREGHSSGWGGRVVGGGEQAPEGSNGHLSGSQGESQQWMGWASSWAWGTGG